MKTTRTKVLFVSILLSAAVPSMLFSAEDKLIEQLKQEGQLPESIKSAKPSELDRVVLDYCAKNILMLGLKKGEPGFKIIQLLLQFAIGKPDQFGNTALKCAVYEGNSEVVKALLEHNADVDETSSDGYTALGFAAFQGDFTMAKLLFENNAKPHFRANKSKRTPLQIAEKQGYPEIVTLLRRSKAGSEAGDE